MLEAVEKEVLKENVGVEDRMWLWSQKVVDSNPDSSSCRSLRNLLRLFLLQFPTFLIVLRTSYVNVHIIHGEHQE